MTAATASIGSAHPAVLHAQARRDTVRTALAALQARGLLEGVEDSGYGGIGGWLVRFDGTAYRWTTAQAEAFVLGVALRDEALTAADPLRRGPEAS